MKQQTTFEMRHIPDLTKDTLHEFIAESIESGSVVRTDGLPAYGGLQSYRHEPVVVTGSGKTADELLPRVHRVISLFKRWLLGNPPRGRQPPASGLLPRRVYVSVHPSHVKISRQAVLPVGPAGRAGRAAPVPKSHQPPGIGAG